MKNLESLFDKLQITTNVFHNGQYCGNWQIDTSGTGFINFHAVTHGQCYLHRNDDGPVLLEKGDMVLLPVDSPHLLSPTKTHTYKNVSASSIPVSEKLGAEGPVLLCGYFEYQHPLMRVITKELPEFWIIKKASKESRVLHESLQLLISASLEVSDSTFTSSVLLNKIAEVVFLLIVKHLMSKYSSTLGALLHPAIANSLQALHNAPEQHWNVEMLASIANMSKSNYAAKFKACAGVTPIKYLTQWRLRCACTEIIQSNKPLITIANQYGYETEASFSKAFKREIGVSPSQKRVQTRPA